MIERENEFTRTLQIIRTDKNSGAGSDTDKEDGAGNGSDTAPKDGSDNTGTNSDSEKDEASI